MAESTNKLKHNTLHNIESGQGTLSWSKRSRQADRQIPSESLGAAQTLALLSNKSIKMGGAIAPGKGATDARRIKTTKKPFDQIKQHRHQINGKVMVVHILPGTDCARLLPCIDDGGNELLLERDVLGVVDRVARKF